MQVLVDKILGTLEEVACLGNVEVAFPKDNVEVARFLTVHDLAKVSLKPNLALDNYKVVLCSTIPNKFRKHRFLRNPKLRQLKLLDAWKLLEIYE